MNAKSLTLLICSLFCFAVLPVGISMAQGDSQQPADKKSDPLSALDFFIGNWTGEGTGPGGKSKSQTEFSRVLNGKAVQITSRSEFESKDGKPGGAHEDSGMVHVNNSTGQVTFRQYHGEGFFNRYVMKSEDDGTTIVFTSDLIENFGPGWSARLTMKVIDRAAFSEVFELKKADGDWSKVSENSYHRVIDAAKKTSAGKPVVHFEIGCRDRDKTNDFYTMLFGWKTSNYGPSGKMISTESKEGIQGHITALGHEPHNYIMFYVEVKNIGEHLAKVKRLGGETVIPETPIPGVGKFAWIKDLDGNLVGLMTSNKKE